MPAIVVYDGVCNLCNGAVRFILKRDKKKLFQFAWLQSLPGRAILEKYCGATAKNDSIVLMYGEKVFTRSDAILEILKMLGGGWQYLYVLRLIPKGFRDALYDFISRNRYKWFGKRDRCELPEDPNFRDRFLND